MVEVFGENQFRRESGGVRLVTEKDKQLTVRCIVLTAIFPRSSGISDCSWSLEPGGGSHHMFLLWILG